MPRFHFHLDGAPDEEGTELKDLASAKCEAIKFAGQRICGEAGTFWNDAEWSLTVTDEKGLTFFQLQIIGTESAAIRPPLPRSAAA
jgi:hypothetical protein